MSRPWVLADPPQHPYVDRLDGTVARLVHRDASPILRWDPAWITARARDWDVAHLHLGLTRAPAASLVAAVEAHRERGVPVVVTVHDLASPDGTRTTDLLRAIDRSVAAVVTLTEACADVLQAALNRPVRVIPHGPVLPRPARERLRATRRLQGVPNPFLVVADELAGRVGWVEAVEATTRTLSPRRMRIAVAPDQAALVARTVAGYPLVDVLVLERPEVLHRAVADAAALVLPLRGGGHSWLVELAADTGTPVIATDVGFLSAQHPVVAVRSVDGHVDVDDLAAAMDGELPPPVTDAERDRQALAFRRGHERLYRRLVLGRTLSRTASPRFEAAG